MSAYNCRFSTFIHLEYVLLPYASSNQDMRKALCYGLVMATTILVTVIFQLPLNQ